MVISSYLSTECSLTGREEGLRCVLCWVYLAYLDQDLVTCPVAIKMLNFMLNWNRVLVGFQHLLG